MSIAPERGSRKKSLTLVDPAYRPGYSLEVEDAASGRSTLGASTFANGTDTLLSPAPLFELLRGFMAFKTLAAANELDLFTHTSDRLGVTSEEIARRLGIAPRPAEMLLTACASLGLLIGVDGRYRNAPLAEAFLVSGRPSYLGSVVEMYDKRLYQGWAKLTQAILTDRPTTWNPERQGSLFESEDPSMRGLFWEAMHAQSGYTARVLGQVVDLSGHRRLLDVGGGSGAYAIELCRLHLNLQATVYDLPLVTDMAREKVVEAGLEDRVSITAGDFFADASLPRGHDLALLSLVLHDWSPEKNRVILEKCYRALLPGGHLIISEQLVDNDKTGPPGAALRSLTMLVETEGRNYTPAEYASWLQKVGFTGIRTIRLSQLDSHGLVIAQKL